MRGIEFVSLTNDTFRRHTADDWKLVMNKKIIGTPAVKERRVELTDRDGVLDFTESLTGVPSYGTRPLSFQFEYLDSLDEWPEIITEIRNFLHGKRVKIHEPDDPDYYYIGRVSVGDPSDGLVKALSIEATADTWKYPVTGETTVTEVVAASKTVNLVNSWRPVCPTIKVTGAVVFTFGGVNYSIAGAGTFRFPKFRLGYGLNVVTLVSGSGTITFTYQEGAL